MASLDPIAIPPIAETSTSSYAQRTGQVLAAPFSPLLTLKEKFDAWQRKHEYHNSPGLFEDIGKPMRTLFASSYAFEGARADLTKTCSVNPVFQVAHSFQLGGMFGPNPNPGQYNFAAIYGSDTTFLNGTIDGDGMLNARCNYAVSPQTIARVQAQMTSQQSMIMLQHDHEGPGYSTSFKAINPSLADLTGAYGFNAFYSFTRRLDIGFDAAIANQGLGPGALFPAVSFAARYRKPDDFTIVGQFAANGPTISFAKKLSDKVEAGAELSLTQNPMEQERTPVASVGAKYDYRASTLRAQLESTGKVIVHLEQRLNQAMALLFSGEIDHSKNVSKFGIGVMLESAGVDEAAVANMAPASPPV